MGKSNKPIIVAYGPRATLAVPTWLAAIADVFYFSANGATSEKVPVPDVLVLFDGIAVDFGDEIHRYGKRFDVPVYRYISKWGHFAALTMNRKERWVHARWKRRDTKKEKLMNRRTHDERKAATVATKPKPKPKPKSRAKMKPPYFNSWRRELLAILLKAEKPMTSADVKELCTWPNVTWGLSDLARNGSTAAFVKAEPGPGAFKLYSITDKPAAWDYLIEDRLPDFPMPVQVELVPTPPASKPKPEPEPEPEPKPEPTVRLPATVPLRGTIAGPLNEVRIETGDTISVDVDTGKVTVTAKRAPDLTPLPRRRYRTWRNEILAVLAERGAMTATEMRQVTGYVQATSALADFTRGEDPLVHRFLIEQGKGNHKARFAYEIKATEAVGARLAAAERTKSVEQLAEGGRVDGVQSILEAVYDLRNTLDRKVEQLENACLEVAEELVDAQERLATIRHAVNTGEGQ